MNWKQKFNGSGLVTIGFFLSPLTWWNDLVVNIPLALLFAWTVGWFYPPAFEVSLVAGYWLTNVVGLVLLHKGGQQLLSRSPQPYSRRQLVKDVLISLLYTGLIIVLVKLGVLMPFEDYFSHN